MGIVGVGVDLCEIGRLRRAMGRAGFRRRVFSDTEARDCRGRAHPEIHFAARFAAKEAYFKALGTGWSGGIGWRDVSVRSRRAGAPSLRVGGAAARASKALGVTRSHLSLSHAGDYAVAVVVLEADGPTGARVRRGR